jgi:hypothetical protein
VQRKHLLLALLHLAHATEIPMLVLLLLGLLLLQITQFWVSNGLGML